MLFRLVLLLVGLLGMTACSDHAWNSPYNSELAQKPILFSSFSSPPKHLDPVVSYNANEWGIISQVYEPLLQYHYLKQPYAMEPLTLAKMPSVDYLNADGDKVEANATHIAYSEYHFQIKEDILYQPHPAFVKDGQGNLTLANLTHQQLSAIHKMGDFDQKATRALTVEDYVFAIKRMAVQQNHSPILGTMIQYIVGLKDFSKEVTQATKKQKDYPLTEAFRSKQIEGVKVVSDTEFSIKIKGQYPQFLYWLTMNFFAPIPWEAPLFFNQPGLAKKNITLDTYPVGTGPYMLVENNPNKRMHLMANPNYQHGSYPINGLSEDADSKLLDDAGKQLPFIKEVIYSLEKESVPLWNKFLQGYYDASGVSSDSFDQAISISTTGNMNLSLEMQKKGIEFLNVIEPTIFYFAFNMADPLVGGYSQKQRKLRQAISIAINTEEYISIFLNGRGIPAQGPIPPGLFGTVEGEAGINPYLYNWVNGRAERKSIEEAKKLLAEAGYPNGRDAKGQSLKIHYDTAATGPDSKSVLNWYRKQLAKLGIELIIRSTDYNRFQDKVRGAKVQTFSWGWNADYPDPENFLFLLAGVNAPINTNGMGVNGANYDRKEYNDLFQQVKTMSNSPERLALIQKMVRILQEDAPWSWGFHPKSLALYHSWYGNVWANPLANNTIKYKKIYPQLRLEKQQHWNQPIMWPFIVVILLLIGSIYPLMRAYQNRQKTTLSGEGKVK